MFRYYQPTRIHFGEGALDSLGGICLPYGKTCFLVTTPDAPLQPLYERVKKLLRDAEIKVIHFDKVEPNPTVEIVEQGFEMLKKYPASFVLAVGGGSSIDTAKAIAFTNGLEKIDWDTLFTFDSPYEVYCSYNDAHLPLLSIPTTSGTGSQVTPAAVITRGKEKLTFFHSDNFSKECIIDPKVMTTLPKRMSAVTGFDAFTHAFESYINVHASHYSKMDSVEAMRLVIENIEKVLSDGSNVTYRTNMCLADTLAGRALSNSGASAPHPLSEIIGGVVHITHGEALAIVFPPFIKQMEAKYYEAFQEVATLFGSEDLYTSIVKMLQSIGLYKTLQDCGVSMEEFEEILSSPVLDHLPYGTREELVRILKEAYG